LSFANNNMGNRGICRLSQPLQYNTVIVH